MELKIDNYAQLRTIREALELLRSNEMQKRFGHLKLDYDDAKRLQDNFFTTTNIFRTEGNCNVVLKKIEEIDRQIARSLRSSQ